VRRRAFLLGGAAVALVGAGGLASIRGWKSRVQREDASADHASAGGDPHSELHSGPPTGANAKQGVVAPIFPVEDRPLLLALADAIMPRAGDHPAASEIDLLPRLERWVHTSDSRIQIYERGWPRLRAALERAGEAGASGPSSRTLRALYRRFRLDEQPPPEAAFFEQLRRDVLRVYYASPAGWASVDYTGPAHRPHPASARGAQRA